MTAIVEPQDLRIGMFVHLDVGWMSHPFPLSSFKIGSREQIETIRSLGLKKLRWSPERSDQPVAECTTASSAGEVLRSETMPELAQPNAPIDPAEQARRRADARREAELAALRICERQYQEACRDLRRINDSVGGEPEQARDNAKALTRALLDKMLVDGELCVRVLGEPSGDRRSAHAINVTVVSANEKRHVFIDGVCFVFAAIDPLFHAGSGGGAEGRLTAPMPGKVIALIAPVGARIEKGAPLLILEAMKMEHTITAPAAGTVMAFCYAAGEQVADGAALVEFEGEG